MASVEGEMSNPYLTNFDIFLPPMMNGGQMTQSPHDLYRISHGILLDVSAALPISNGGADNSAAAKGFQPAHLTGDPPIAHPCPLGFGCAVPLEGTTTSIYRHLRRHGLIHNHRDRAPCPWPGCHRDMRWGNVARHIIENHLGVRLRCMFCRRSYTRLESLKAHTGVCVVGTSGMSNLGNC
ncbi:hypothetical protein F5141DRAFT_741058 [Pisolithus sp. B1]|nr:hypothetical protein F5141DRAFT_741058 [Pisolithus sp. B1]